METADQIIEELRPLGKPSIKKVLTEHGAREPFFGVPIGDLKPIVKRLKPQYQLALDLYATGISDAMYLAGLIVDDRQMTREDLHCWVDAAYWSMLSESTVPWVAAGSPFGGEKALEWIESEVESTACAGWRTLGDLAALRPDADLDLPHYQLLLARVQSTIQQSPNRVRYCMNSFVIHVGTYIAPLSQQAIQAAESIGEVKVSMGKTACRVAPAPQTIATAIEKGKLGKKLKTVKC